MAVFYGTTNPDTVNGASGNDTLYGWATGGNATSPSGKDTLKGKAGNDKLYGGTDNDSLYGDEGNDSLDGASGNDYLSGGRGNDNLYGEAGDDTLRGWEDNDSLYGGFGNDSLNGETGNDHLYGEAGNDTLNGGAGNDTYIIDSTSDTIIEAADSGKDNVQAAVSYALGNNLETLTLTGTSKINGTGNSLDNTITSGLGSNELYGEGGNDTLFGGLGNDTLNGEFYVDGYSRYVDFSGYSDTIFGNGNDYLDGGDGEDVLTGGNLNDTLIGGIGNDFLYGEDLRLVNVPPDDTSNSGVLVDRASGADHFVFNSANEGIDSIVDFGSASEYSTHDTIDVSAVGFGGGLTADTSITADQFVIGTAALDSSDRFIYNKTNGFLFFDVDGVGGIGQVHFATLLGNPDMPLMNVPAITNNDIFVTA